MSKRYVSAFLLFLVTSAAVFASDSYTIVSFSFNPDKFYVGDLVEYTCDITVDGNPELKEPEQMPIDKYIAVDKISVVKMPDYYRIRIEFISFEPGQSELPPIDLGAFVLENLKIYTTPVLGQELSSISDLMPQMFLPGSMIFAIIIISFLLTAPLLSFFLTKKFKEKFKNYNYLKRRRKPLRTFLRSIKDLTEKSIDLSPKEFYIIFINVFRKYLTDRTGHDFYSITAREISEKLSAIIKDQEVVISLMQIISFGEEVKFGGRETTIIKERDDLIVMKTGICKIENYLVQQENTKQVLNEAETIEISEESEGDNAGI